MKIFSNNINNSKYVMKVFSYHFFCLKYDMKIISYSILDSNCEMKHYVKDVLGTIFYILIISLLRFCKIYINKFFGSSKRCSLVLQ